MNNFKTGLRRFLIVFSAVSALIFPPACTRNAEEDRVREVIVSIRDGAENKDLKEMLNHISRTYRDPQGNDFDGIKNLILFYFFRHPKIKALLPDIQVSVDGLAAKAGFEAILSNRGGESGTVLPDALGAYRFDVSLTKTDKGWKVVSAQWERLGNASASP